VSAANDFDVLVIGAGIAGASVAYFLAPHARVGLIERESQPGYHTTGRSAAMFMESYGPAQVRALTRASRAFLATPADGETALLSPRGALYIARGEQAEQVRALHERLRSEGAPARLLDTAAARALVPALRREAAALALLDDDACDIDVDRLHQRFLRGARRHGAQLVCSADVCRIAFTQGRWSVSTPTQRFTAQLLVSAAGAWADVVAALAGVAPLGLQPCRRSAFTFAPPAGVDVRGWPCVASIDESFYFKPEAGVLLGSPANADPVTAHDVVAEELDIATGIERIEQNTTLAIRRPLRTWAGLRSFVPDGALVGGFDDGVPTFFWCCGQGGYGIQTSPAMGEACAARLLGRPLPAHIVDQGLAFADLAPRRQASNEHGKATG
jgi:D-arginine dehydrogenase